jgi:hypothetical protein
MRRQAERSGKKWKQPIGRGHVLVGCYPGRKAEFTVSSSTRRLEDPAKAASL